jgi:exonuclease III
VRILQWNIERGYQLPAIIQELQRLDADVLGLQEVRMLAELRSLRRAHCVAALEVLDGLDCFRGMCS